MCLSYLRIIWERHHKTSKKAKSPKTQTKKTLNRENLQHLENKHEAKRNPRIKITNFVLFQ